MERLFELPGEADTEHVKAEGCPNLAAYEVIHYSFDLAEGAVVFAQDESCPLHLRRARDRSRRRLTIPYTNRSPGISIYRQQVPAYVA
jgi:hypothetical protein